MRIKLFNVYIDIYTTYDCIWFRMSYSFIRKCGHDPSGSPHLTTNSGNFEKKKSNFFNPIFFLELLLGLTNLGFRES